MPNVLLCFLGVLSVECTAYDIMLLFFPLLSSIVIFPHLPIQKKSYFFWYLAFLFVCLFFNPNMWITIKLTYYIEPFQLQPNSAAGSGALEHDSCCLYRPLLSVSSTLKNLL